MVDNSSELISVPSEIPEGEISLPEGKVSLSALGRVFDKAARDAGITSQDDVDSVREPFASRDSQVRDSYVDSMIKAAAEKVADSSEYRLLKTTLGITAGVLDTHLAAEYAVRQAMSSPANHGTLGSLEKIAGTFSAPPTQPSGGNTSTGISGK